MDVHAKEASASKEILRVRESSARMEEERGQSTTRWLEAPVLLAASVIPGVPQSVSRDFPEPPLKIKLLVCSPPRVAISGLLYFDTGFGYRGSPRYPGEEDFNDSGRAC